MKIVPKSSIVSKLEIFKNGGRIPMFKESGTLLIQEGLNIPTYEGDFGNAFTLARMNKVKTFRWNGSLYNTKIDYDSGSSLMDLIKLNVESPTLDRVLNFNGIETTNNRPYNVDDISYINSKLSSIPAMQRAAILANIIEESGGDPYATGPGGFYGLLQWGPDRYKKKSAVRQEEMDAQILYILDTMNDTTDKMSWHHGGTGSGYKSAVHANLSFNNSTTVDDVNKAYTLGYVRPAGKLDSSSNRSKVANQIYEIIK